MPILIFTSIVIAIVFMELLHMWLAGAVILASAVVFGSMDLMRETVATIRRRKFALDYIAILAIAASLGTGHLVVAAIIVLMLTSGTTLEQYGMERARRSLSRLIARIPVEASKWEDGRVSERIPVGSVTVGDVIAVRRGEVFPLDGMLVSSEASADESSLTGEPYFIDKVKGDVIRSGTVNMGDLAVVRVTRVGNESTYAKIITMVEDAQARKAPLVRLADRYSGVFTIITLAIAGAAYAMSGDMLRVLAVLVIATPCPLILATPIALIGGINAAARRRAIIKDIGSIEVLSRVTSMVFDKTGTITLGKPEFAGVTVLSRSMSDDTAIAVAEALERNSLHPLAKALVDEAKRRGIHRQHAREVTEVIGKGIRGRVGNATYALTKAASDTGMAIALFQGDKEIAVFTFTDRIKPHAKSIMQRLVERGLSLYLFTGDRKNAADDVARSLGIPVTVYAGMSPEEKMHGIDILHGKREITAMVGDGINDAPALARADVGMVFAHEEQTAASEAADVVFFGGDMSDVAWVLSVSRKTVGIALQSIFVGIGLSIIGMVAAAAGYIPPTAGAVIQECIDVAVIINALRTSRIS